MHDEAMHRIGSVRDYSIEKLALLRTTELRQADVHLLPSRVLCRAGGEWVLVWQPMQEQDRRTGDGQQTSYEKMG